MGGPHKSGPSSSELYKVGRPSGGVVVVGLPGRGTGWGGRGDKMAMAAHMSKMSEDSIYREELHKGRLYKVSCPQPSPCGL